MLRAIICGALGVALLAGCNQSPTTGSPPEQTGRGRGRRAGGTIENVDPAAGTLTIKQRQSRNAEAVEKTYQVDEDTTITSFTGENKTELKGKAGLNDPQFQRGSRVSLTLSEDGNKAVSIRVGDMPRGGRGRGRGGRGAPAPMQ
jgi:hypothetical protein